MNKYGFKVGPPDDAGSETMMRVGLAAKKSAVKYYKSIGETALKCDPSIKPKKLLEAQWQGMVAISAYAITITDQIFTELGWLWDIDGEQIPHSTELLIDQVRELTERFKENIGNAKENNND